MRMWFELGVKIGCIELARKLCYLPSVLISPHDIEATHYEILDQMKEMALDNSKIIDSKIDDYERIVLDLIKKPNKRVKRQLFLLGYHTTKLKMLLIYDVDDMFNERRKDLYDLIIENISSLNLSNTLKEISLEEYKEKDFERIEEAVNNNSRFDTDKSIQQHTNHPKESYIVIIIGALITAAATIIAAIISKA